MPSWLAENSLGIYAGMDPLRWCWCRAAALRLLAYVFFFHAPVHGNQQRTSPNFHHKTLFLEVGHTCDFTPNVNSHL